MTDTASPSNGSGHQSEDDSPENSGNEEAVTTEDAPAGAGKKKKKRKTKSQRKAAARNNEAAKDTQNAANAIPSMPILKISRNKHMKYISSYHGPWLQLPSEVLDSLLQVNCDPEALPTVRGLMEAKPNGSHLSSQRYKALASSAAYEPSVGTFTDGDERLPPPIDPSVFRGVTVIRRLVDDAADLAVRAASGMSAAALGALNMSSGASNNNALGIDPNKGGREVTMSPLRQHRLRALAVSKLAEAYKIDEIAASVAVMQGATGLDDLALRVLKHDADNVDAQYVQFFHEKIPSRTLALSTDTSLLDELILRNPTRLEYYRTRGIVHGFKQDYPSAIRNFTQALSQAKATRKAKAYHAGDSGGKSSRKKGRGGKGAQKEKERAAADTTASVPAREEATGIGKEPGDDLERQMLFHRGMSHFHYACKLIEDTVLDIEGVEHPQGGLSNEGGELTLRNIGVVLKDELAGLYGCAAPSKQEEYRTALGDPALKEKVQILLRRSIRDQERFLSYFSVWEAPSGSVLEDEKKFHNPRSTDKPLTFRGRRLIHHRSLCGRTRHGDPRRPEVRAGTVPPEPALLTTYHPLIIEAHFSVLLNHLLLGDYAALVGLHYKTARLMDYLEGYPVFLPARSLNQSEYAEVLERLAVTWLKQRETEQGLMAPEGTEEEVAKDGDLKSLHHLLSFFTEDFVAALVAAAEDADREAKDEMKAKASSNSYMKMLDNKEAKGTWAEEREKAEAERRKVDPSYATYNTARAEAALVWLSAIVLPEKEAEEKVGRDKGKAPAEGRGANGAGSSSRAMYEEDEEE